MAELRIYDSQGKPIRDESGSLSQQVKDFFFDGVRIAVDGNRNELFCFFRARDNDTARSEQYYAQYNYQSRSEMGNIYEAVQARIEGEYGMILDTENEDTRFFELLGSSGSGRVPDDASDLDDVESVLSDFQSARLGVGSYNEAYGLFGKLFRNSGVNKIAVSDNATGQSLSSYDLVIEKGDYFGVELLGDTADKVESLRKQRRMQFESDYGSGDDNDPISGAMGALLFAGGGLLLIAAVVYGSCLGLGMALPGIGEPPGVACGPTLNDVNADVAGNDSQQVRITGNITGLSNTSTKLTVSVVDDNDTERFKNTSNRTLDSSGGFNFTVQPGPNETDLDAGNYTAVVTYRNKSMNDTFTVGNGSGATPTESGTPTATPGSETTTATPDGGTNTSTPGGDTNTSESDNTSTTNATVIDVFTADTASAPADSLWINGTTTGLGGQNISFTVEFTSIANGTQLNNSGGQIETAVATDGSFATTVPFNPGDTEGPYEATVTFDDPETTRTISVNSTES